MTRAHLYISRLPPGAVGQYVQLSLERLATRDGLFPQKSTLSFVLDRTAYETARSSGVVWRAREQVLPPAFAASGSSVVAQLYTLLDAVSCDTAHPDAPEIQATPAACGRSIPHVLQDGGMLLDIAGVAYLLDAQSFADTELTFAELDTLRRHHVLQYRAQQRSAHNPLRTRPAVSSPAPLAALDLETFAQGIRQRWTTDPLPVVIASDALSAAPLGDYSALQAWLAKRQEYIASHELVYLQQLLDRLTRSASVAVQARIGRLLTGRLADLALREELVLRYRIYCERHPAGVLLLGDQIRDGQGKKICDAIIGHFESIDGQSCFVTGEVYTISSSDHGAQTQTIRLETDVPARLGKQIYLTDTFGCGSVVPVQPAGGVETPIDGFCVPQFQIDAIHQVVGETVATAMTRFQARSWRMPGRGASTHAVVPVGNGIRPGSSVREACTPDRLNEWADQLQSDTLHLSCFPDHTGFRVGSEPPTERELKVRTYIQLTRTVLGVWHVTALGSRVPDLFLDALADEIQVRSIEWLSRDHYYPLQSSRVTFRMKGDLAHLSQAVLDQWGSPEEWNSHTLRVMFGSREEGVGWGFTLATRLPVDPKKTVLTFFRLEGRWRLASLHHTEDRELLDVLRATDVKIPSDEWLSRTLKKTISRFSDPAVLITLTPDEVRRWEREWGGPVVLQARPRKSNDGSYSLSGIEIVPRAAPFSPKMLRMEFSPDGQGIMLRGVGLRIVLPALRENPYFTLPSNEYLNHRAVLRDGSRRNHQIAESAFRQMARWSSLAPEELDRWCGEFGSDLLVGFGRPITEGSVLSPVGIDSNMPATGLISGAVVLMLRTAAGWRVEGIAGRSADSWLAALKANPDIPLAGHAALGHGRIVSLTKKWGPFAPVLDVERLDELRRQWRSATLLALFRTTTLPSRTGDVPLRIFWGSLFAVDAESAARLAMLSGGSLLRPNGDGWAALHYRAPKAYVTAALDAMGVVSSVVP